MTIKQKVTLTEKTISKQQVEILAIFNTLFLRAMNDGDNLGKICYGGRLNDIQNEINFYLVEKDLLETIISEAENIQCKGAA
jgi:hypothetical protein